jgi:hypothetical protein
MGRRPSRRSGKGGIRAQGGRRRAAKRSSRPSTPRRSLEEVLERLVEAAQASVSIDVIGLSVNDLREALKPLAKMLLESGDPDKAVKRLINDPRNLYTSIAYYLLSQRDRLTQEQLDILASSDPAVLLSQPRKVYREAVREGRSDIVALLREAWNKQYEQKLVLCPRCGFYAVVESMECIICGAKLSSSDLKQALDVEEMLKLFAEEKPAPDIMEAAEEGRILLCGGSLYAPSKRPRDSVCVEISLSQQERQIIREHFRRRTIGQP